MGIRTGVSAIMADRSMLSFEENVAQVKLLAEVAHAAGVSIEAELGHVGQGSNYAVDGVSMLTDPEEARKFIELTGVDGLAVAIGTAHGAYVGTPHLDFERLAEIDAACHTPLVLHGGSGSGDENIHKACTMGIAKVNVVTDVLNANFRTACEGDFSGNACHRFYPALSDSTKNFVKHLFEVTGSTGKAASIGKSLAKLTEDTAKAEAMDDELAKATSYYETILSDMDVLRASVDAAESLIPEKYLSYPTYGQLLFSLR